MREIKTHQHFLKRRAGVLLHPGSLPVEPGRGALGSAATRFIDFLVSSGFSVWQMLPVQPVDKFGSPYQCTSAHAGNPDLICKHKLLANNWMTADGHQHDIDLPDVTLDLVNPALQKFTEHATDTEQAEYAKFKNEHSFWLDDYALFCVIKDVQKGKPWWQWPQELSCLDKETLQAFRSGHRSQIERYYFEQFIFFCQWHDLRTQAANKNILLLGDMPIFVAHDSVDVWVHRRYFRLDDKGHATVVAGVPPDYFSATGQRWGNPMYDWTAMQAADFHWWIERLRTQLELFDLVRMDHFRGFEANWEIPAACPTATDGEWKPVPGRRLFQALHDVYGDLPLVAEDLGIISTEVNKLRDDFRLPGTKVLQFAFDSDAENPYLPHNHVPVGLVCTGTHDNNTSKGWFDNLDDPTRLRLMDYLQNSTELMPWPLVRAALASVACLAMLPMQDLLGLDQTHRMNTPGTTEGNWCWRFDWDWLPADLPERLKHMNHVYGRC